MKKTILVTLMVAAAGLIASELNAQPPWAPAWGKRRKQQQAFYYYPGANTYYSPDSRRYIYPHRGSWLSEVAPRFGFPFNNAQRYTVYNDGPDVWRQNPAHMKQYNGVYHDDQYYDPRYNNDRRYNKHGRHHDEDEDDDDERYEHRRKNNNWNWPQQQHRRHHEDDQGEDEDDD